MNHTNGVMSQFQRRITATCPFCEKSRDFDKSYWLSHIISHTGEFTHGCKSCGKFDVQSRSNCCNRSDFVQIRSIKVEDNQIVGFACKLCNFVKFSEESVNQHVRNNHDSIDDIAEQYCFITFLNMNAKGAVNDDSYEPVLAQNLCEVSIVLEDCGKAALLTKRSASHGVTQMNVPQEEAEMDDSNCVFEEKDSLDLTLPNGHIEVKVENEIPSESCIIDLDTLITEYKTEHEMMFDGPVLEAPEPETIEILSDEEDDSPNGQMPVKTEHNDEPTILTIVLDDSDDEGLPGHSPHSVAAEQVRVKTEDPSCSMPLITNVKHESVDVSAPVALKPWTNCTTRKNANVCHLMLHDIALFALFKCMANDCLFTCQSKEIMAVHLQNHEQNRQTAPVEKEDSKVDWADHLECAYCCEYLTSWVDLIEHIMATHSNNIFQCQYCFYRSIDAYATFHHQQKFHKGRQPAILMCNGFDRTIIQKNMKELVMKQVDNVIPIVCPEGDISYSGISNIGAALIPFLFPYSR